MKKLFGTLLILDYLGLFLLFFLIGCTNETTLKSNETTELYRGNNIEIYEYDGCEYVKFPLGQNTWGGHKGNCKNPIHYHKDKIVEMKFIDMDGNFSGKCTIDSMTINYKKRMIYCWSGGNILLMTSLKDMGMTTIDIKK